MAIDPSIALDVKQPQSPLSMVGEYASASAALQSVQNQKAALPGIEADSAIKQRAASFNKWLTANSSQYVTVDDSPDGRHQVNYSGLIAAAAQAGYVPEAQSVAASDLKNQSTYLQNGLTAATTKNTEAATNGTNLNNANTTASLAISSRGYVSTLMDAYVKANPNAPQDMYDKEYNKLLTGVQDQYGSALNVRGVFGPPDQVATGQDGKTVTDPNTGKPQMSYRFDPTENSAMLTATMSPQVQAELQNSREIISQSGATGQSSAAFRDPNSPETKNARAIAIAADPTMAEVYSQMTGAQLASNPRVGPSILATINPAGARTTAVANMTQQVNDAKQYGNAADALEKLKSRFPDQANLIQASPFAWIQNNTARFANDPAFVTAQTALGAVNQVHPELKLSGLDAGSLSQALRFQQNNSLNLAGTSGAVATAPTIAGAASGVAASGGKPGATATNPKGNGTTGTVKMKDAQGKTYNIPSNKVQAAKADGLTTVQ